MFSVYFIETRLLENKDNDILSLFLFLKCYNCKTPPISYHNLGREIERDRETLNSSKYDVPPSAATMNPNFARSATISEKAAHKGWDG